VATWRNTQLVCNSGKLEPKRYRMLTNWKVLHFDLIYVVEVKRLPAIIVKLLENLAPLQCSEAFEGCIGSIINGSWEEAGDWPATKDAVVLKTESIGVSPRKFSGPSHAPPVG
jgi:hypothetical protein